MKHNKPITGKITLETRDAKTGSLCQRITTHNFIANQATLYAQWLQRSYYKAGLSTVGSSDTDYPPHPAHNCLVLTDSTLAENAGTEWQIPGNMIGYATKATYAGTDPFRGTPNISQLDAQNIYTKWVFDWPTTAGNGNINSVCWGESGYVDSGTSGSGPFFSTVCTNAQQWSTTSGWTYFARASSSQAFGNTGNTVISVLDGNYAQTTTFNVNGQFTSVLGIAWDSGNSFLWVIGDNGGTKRIAAYNAAGALQTGHFNITNRNYIALAYDGTNLWSVTQDSQANHTAWSINVSTGADVTNFTFTTYKNNFSTYSSYHNKVCGLAWDATYSRLWVRTAYSTVGTIDNNGQQTRGALYSFNTNGVKQTPDISLRAYTPSTGTYDLFLWSSHSSSIVRDFDMIDANQFAMPHNSIVYRIRVDCMGSRALLPSTVNKTNTQTLKVIYQIDYS